MRTKPNHPLKRAIAALSLATFLLLSGIGACFAEIQDKLMIGNMEYALKASGTRSQYFFSLYRLGIYKEGSKTAYVVEIMYDGSVPDKIPSNWQNELLPLLSAEQEKKLKGEYAQLTAGDVIVIANEEDTATVRVNGKAVLSNLKKDQNEQLLRAFNDIWLGDKPVSDSLKKDLSLALAND